MKCITSDGGPLVALNRADVARWGGIDTLKFFQSSQSFRNDYEHLCFEVETTGGTYIGKAFCSDIEMLILHYPIPTFIASTGKDHIYLAQIDASEPDWSPESLSESDFEGSINWADPFEITLKGGELVLFDSACVESDFRDDTLSAEVSAGKYRCECSYQSWEGKADMNFMRLIRKI